MAEENVIVVKDLRKSYKKVDVLKGIDFSVRRGTVLALLGPNGAGKTTTIRILSTLLVPDGGSASVSGFDVVKEADGVRHSIGLTGQYAAVDEYLTGEENLVMMGRLYRLSADDARRRARELLTQFDLTDASGRPAKMYSGGMRRRLDLAISLIASPPVLFLDEPTTGLDPPSRLMLWRMIKGLAAQGIAILLTTQYMDEADQLADRILVIDHGKVIAEGTADELKRKVGAERLEVAIAPESDFGKAKAAIGGKALRADPERRTLSITLEGGVGELKQVLARLEAAGVEPQGVTFSRPTLDDVFLKLTGHTTQEDEAAGKEAGAKAAGKKPKARARRKAR